MKNEKRKVKSSFIQLFTFRFSLYTAFMAYLQPDKPEKVYVPALRAAKEKGEKLV